MNSVPTEAPVIPERHCKYSNGILVGCEYQGSDAHATPNSHSGTHKRARRQPTYLGRATLGDLDDVLGRRHLELGGANGDADGRERRLREGGGGVGVCSAVDVRFYVRSRDQTQYKRTMPEQSWLTEMPIAV